MYGSYFKKVEEILDKFPNDCRVNYYENKKSLKIDRQTVIFNNLYGTYDDKTNEIILYRESSLPHELFHVAFRDGKKIEKKIFDDSNVYYGNGISYSKPENDRTIIRGKALTEGFAEYLSRMCCDAKGRSIEYFFTDLLISIYGEEIICYTLKNDPVGFYGDERFNAIMLLSTTFDYLYDFSEGIKTISRCIDKFNKVFNEGTLDDKQKLMKTIFDVKQGFKTNLVELFEILVEEYDNCNEPKIYKEDFVKKMEVFINSEEYQYFFILDDNIKNIKKEIKKIIKNFNRGKSKV